MRALLELMAAHTAALAAYDDFDEAQWRSPQARKLGDEVIATRDVILAHRPTTREEIATKAEFMAKTRTFIEWDDFDRIKLIHALTPAKEATP